MISDGSDTCLESNVNRKVWGSIPPSSATLLSKKIKVIYKKFKGRLTARVAALFAKQLEPSRVWESGSQSSAK